MNNQSTNYPRIRQTYQPNIADTVGTLTESKKLFTKRQKIIIATVIMTVGLIITQNANLLFYRMQFILGLGIMAYLLSLWALWGEMTKLKAITLLILPALFTIAFAGFYFLFSQNRWLTRLPWALGYGFSFYCLLLSQNVFNVASTRTIALYRAASTVSFVCTIFTAVLLFNVGFSLNLSFYWNALIALGITLPLAFQLLWTVEMEGVNTKLIVTTLLVSFMSGQLAIALSFWPIAHPIWAISQATALYIMLGLTVEFWRERLSNRFVIEYLSVGVIIFLLAYWFTAWTG